MTLIERLRITKWSIAAAILSVTLPCLAKIGVEYQMQLGNPSGAQSDAGNHKHYLVQRSVFALDYDDERGEPNWVSWDLTAADIGPAKRTPGFKPDPGLPSGFHHIKSADYKQSGFDRGHMCPSADRTDNSSDNEEVFVMSNIIPQSKDNNEGVWEKLEADCRAMAENGNELLIVSGPSGFSGDRLPNGPVMIPSHTWKIIVEVPVAAGSILNRITKATRVIAVDIPNITGVRRDPWTKYLVSVKQLEAETGLKFFTALPPAVAEVLKTKVDGQPMSKLSPATEVAQNTSDTNTLVKINSQPQGDWIMAACVILAILLILGIIVLTIFFRMRSK